MSDEFEPDFLDEPDEGDSELVKQLRKALKEAGKKNKVLAGEVETFKNEKAKTELNKVWDELKVPEPIRGFYKGDEAPDAIKKWWEDSKGFFNIQEGSGSDEQPEPEVSPEMQQFTQAANLGSDPDTNGLDAWRAKAAEAGKKASGDPREALTKLLAEGPFKTPQGGYTAPRQT